MRSSYAAVKQREASFFLQPFNVEMIMKRHEQPRHIVLSFAVHTPNLLSRALCSRSKHVCKVVPRLAAIRYQPFHIIRRHERLETPQRPLRLASCILRCGIAQVMPLSITAHGQYLSHITASGFQIPPY